MAVTLSGNVISSDVAPTDPDPDVQALYTVTIEVGGQTLSVAANASDVNALTIPGTCTLTLSQP